MQTVENIPTIIDDLYAGALDDAAWHRGIMGIANLVRGASAIVFGVNPRSKVPFRAEPHNVEREVMSEFADHWADKEIRMPAVLQLSMGEAMFDQKLMPLSSFKQSIIYNEFLVKVDRPWVLCFWLHKLAEKCTMLSIHGSRRRGPLDERDGDIVKPLIPHVRQALEIRDRLEATKIRTETVRHSLNDLGLGIMVLDARGRILETSAAAAELMRQTSAIRRHTDGTLSLREPAGSQLCRWILSGTPPPGNRDGLLHVPREFMRPISVMVTPLPAIHTSWFGGDPRWLILLFDPDRNIDIAGSLIELDLGLSAREAQVVTLLASGYNLQNLSLKLGISVHTAQTHLKNCLIKTGCHSQNELLRRIINSPAWPRR